MGDELWEMGRFFLIDDLSYKEEMYTNFFLSFR